MLAEPTIEQKPAQPYVAIRSEVKFQEIPAKLPPLIPRVQEWLRAQQVQPAGPLFFRYVKMQGNDLEVEVGFPVSSKMAADEDVMASEMPAGKYLSAVYTGPYEQLPQAHSELGKWLKENNIKLTGPCTESYLNDPATEPDPKKWQTEIRYPIA